MKFILTALIITTTLFSCAQTQSNNDNNVKIPNATSQKPALNEAVATFAEGCFWHAEIVFQSLVGVRDAVSGYAGGSTSDPDYEKVASGSTGHAESVKVYYDPSNISYETLVNAFFASQDPTTMNRQGNDAGTEYRSIAFYNTEKEKQVIEAAIKKLTDAKVYSAKIVTQVVPLTKFYPAEDYHQEYISHNSGNPYVVNVSIPDFQHFKAVFKEGKFKP